MEYFHWPAWLPGCAPSPLLHACSLAEYGRLERVLDFTATTENISVINIFLVLNPKHRGYFIPAETKDRTVGAESMFAITIPSLQNKL